MERNQDNINAIFDAFKKAVDENYGVSTDSIKLEDKLEDYVSDSLDLVETVMTMEKFIDESIDDKIYDEVDNDGTVGDFINKCYDNIPWKYSQG